MHFIQLFTNIIFCLFNYFCGFVFGEKNCFCFSFFVGVFCWDFVGFGMRFGANWGFRFLGYWVIVGGC